MEAKLEYKAKELIIYRKERNLFTEEVRWEF
jgi:hypothetical protein